MASQKAVRAARRLDGVGPRDFATTTKRRNSFATTPRLRVQARAPEPNFVSLGDIASRILARLAGARV